MKHLLVAINAKYIHTSLSVRTIHYYLKKNNTKLNYTEYTINQSVSHIVRSLYEKTASSYLFSCYIWNISYIKEIAYQLYQLIPDVQIFLGGPEASYKTEKLFSELPFLAGIIVGEGEETALELINTLNTENNLNNIAGLALNGVTPKARTPIDMDTIAFNYPDVDDLDNRILYYESIRGCPYSCSYCLSSVERGVRARSLDLVFNDLQVFIEAGIRQLKFVDRTFNYDNDRAMKIWAFLIANDNGYTNFHFEITGDSVSPQAICLLKTAREGLFQFEIGVQSINPQTLEEIQRTTHIEKLKNNVLQLAENNNVHLHLDLIAGLPYEDFTSFTNSFNWVFALRPEQFQLGFLKVLGGSLMEQHTKVYDLVYTNTPPFQILKNRWLSYQQLAVLEDTEHIVDHYYNSGRYKYTIDYIVNHYQQSAFNFFYNLSQEYDSFKGEGPLSKMDYFEVIGVFCKNNGIEMTTNLMESCVLDIMLHEKPKKHPSWVTAENPIYSQIMEFYENMHYLKKYLPNYEHGNPKHLSRITHLHFFSTNPLTQEKKKSAFLVNYLDKDILGRAKLIKINELSE